MNYNGWVYRAVDTESKEVKAIKIIHKFNEINSMLAESVKNLKMIIDNVYLFLLE